MDVARGAVGAPSSRKLLRLALVVLFVKARKIVAAILRVVVLKLRSLCGWCAPKPKSLTHLQHIFVLGTQQLIRRLPQAAYDDVVRAQSKMAPSVLKGFEFPMVKLQNTPGHVWLSRKVPPTIRQWSLRDVVVVCMHGGGFHVGSAFMHGHFHATVIKRLEEDSNIDTVSLLSVAYPLAPQNSWFSDTYNSSQAIDACKAAIRWVHDELSVPISNIIVAGDSAGGNLALTTSASLKEEGFFSDTPDKCPRGLLLFVFICDTGCALVCACALLLLVDTRFAPWVDLRPPELSNQPRCEGDSDNFVEPPDAEVLQPSETMYPDRSRPSGQLLSTIATEFAEGRFPDVDDSKSLDCILDPPTIDFFAQTYVGDLSSALVRNPMVSPRFLKPFQLPACPIGVVYSESELFGPCIRHWIEELRAGEVEVMAFAKHGMPHEWLLYTDFFGFEDAIRVADDIVKPMVLNTPGTEAAL